MGENASRAQSTEIGKNKVNKYKIIPKRKSLPAKTKGVDDVYTLAAKFENNNGSVLANKKRRNGITPIQKLDIVSLDPSENKIFAPEDERMFDTMIVHKPERNKVYTPKYSDREGMVARHKPELKIRPAAANPNYQYNYNININGKTKASDRIKMMNQRLENINNQNY